MKKPALLLALVAAAALSACATKPVTKPKTEKPSVAPVRESFSRNQQLIDELEAALNTPAR